MTTLDVFENGVAWVVIGLSLFCANNLLMQREHRHVTLHLAAFFVALAFSISGEVVELFFENPGESQLVFIYSLLVFPTNFILAPLFWLYVRALTFEGKPTPAKFKLLHGLPALIGVILVIGLWNLPLSALVVVQGGDGDLQGWPVVLMTAIQLLSVSMEVQITGYLLATVWMLKRYDNRIRDLFASTESRELRWLWWIAISVIGYVIFNIALILRFVLGLNMLPHEVLSSGWIDTILTFSIIWVIALWGLRQKPGLAHKTPIRSPRSIKSDIPQENKTAKYVRSALTPEHADRIARKIRTAIEKDRLYRNPDLSLWELSNHINVSSNYVSQTLNETIGASFFDFVNQARIKDAMQQILSTEQTVLEIAYDVGFNSRSPFYKAFKRETGITPTAFKNAPDNAIQRPT